MPTTFAPTPSLPWHHFNVCRSIHDLVVKAARLVVPLGCLFLVTIAAQASPPQVPPGPYHQSCKGASMEGTTLVAQCIDFFGNEKKTSLVNATSCKNISNVDGDLRCVISQRPAPQKVGVPVSDIVSVRDVTIGGVAGKVWRIDRPNVWQRTTDYTMIGFKPGERIWFKVAGKPVEVVQVGTNICGRKEPTLQPCTRAQLTSRWSQEARCVELAA